MFHMTRLTEELLSGRPAAGFLLEDHAGENLLDNLLGFRVELGDGLKLELEVVAGAALILGEK